VSWLGVSFQRVSDRRQDVWFDRDSEPLSVEHFPGIETGMAGINHR
jgi:hypothetical protein